MIRAMQFSDIKEVNLLLSEFDFKISKDLFDNAFLNSLVYVDKFIKGVIIYRYVYDRIEIEYIIVNKIYRKNKIGSKLLKELERETINNITLEVRVSNTSAIKFYEKNGFKIATIRKNYYGEEDGYLMIKEIGD